MVNSERDHDKDQSYDIFKDSLVRYLGYANELGESFRPLVHRYWVNASYGVFLLLQDVFCAWPHHDSVH
jgi:hypothetical protein